MPCYQRYSSVVVFDAEILKITHSKIYAVLSVMATLVTANTMEYQICPNEIHDKIYKYNYEEIIGIFKIKKHLMYFLFHNVLFSGVSGA